MNDENKIELDSYIVELDRGDVTITEKHGSIEGYGGYTVTQTVTISQKEMYKVVAAWMQEQSE